MTSFNREEKNVGRSLKHYQFIDGETEASRQEVISLKFTDGAKSRAYLSSAH